MILPGIIFAHSGLGVDAIRFEGYPPYTWGKPLPIHTQVRQTRSTPRLHRPPPMEGIYLLPHPQEGDRAMSFLRCRATQSGGVGFERWGGLREWATHWVIINPPTKYTHHREQKSGRTQKQSPTTYRTTPSHLEHRQRPARCGGRLGFQTIRPGHALLPLYFRKPDRPHQRQPT